MIVMDSPRCTNCNDDGYEPGPGLRPCHACRLEAWQVLALISYLVALLCWPAGVVGLLAAVSPAALQGEDIGFGELALALTVIWWCAAIFLSDVKSS